MSIRMFARRMQKRSITAGTDGVFLGISLPSDAVVHDINILAHILSATTFGIREIGMYAIEGWILPVLDPDAATTFQVLWDNLVPKDTDVETMDLDTAATDATPFFEPGEPDFSDLMEVGLRPERIYSSQRLMSFANAAMRFQDNQTSFSVLWHAASVERIRIKKRFRVTQPSVLLFALASPSLDDTVTTEPAAASEAEWGQTKYIGHVLERALLHLLGITEAGAETPWEEATALLKKHLEPDVFEQTAADMLGVAWDVTARGIVDHSVEGRLGQTSISTGR